MKFTYKETSGVKDNEIAKSEKTLASYLVELETATKDTNYTTPESCLALPFDDALLDEINQLVQKKKNEHLREVMVVGIGGSILGSQAVYHAFHLSPPAGGGVRGGGRDITLSFYDTVDNHNLIKGIETIKRIIAEGRQVLINIISKSGATLETIANARVLIKALQEATPDWQKQVVVTSEPESKLTAWAKSQGIDTLSNPPQVGGRFSVMSAVALFPLALAGIDIKALHHGGRDALLAESATAAAAIFANLKQGKIIHDLFLFDTDLEDLGKWHRQLVGESLGKAGQGITPTVSIGSMDLHSMFQLYISGPKDKYTTFVTLNRDEGVKVPSIDNDFDGLVENITEKTLTEITNAIVGGTKEAYKKQELPFAEIALEMANERELGAFLQFKIAMVLCLAKLMGVDAFGQSSVEEYKSVTKKILSEKS